MKKQEAFLIFALAFVIGVLSFLSLLIVEALHVSSSFAQESAKGLVFPLRQPPEVVKKEVFLKPLEDEEISNLRDVFSFARSYEVFQEEVLPPSDEEVTASLSVLEEAPPAITVKGVVTSPRNQVVVVEVNKEVFFLTPEKPLSGELKLVKVDKKQVVLIYRGREFVFSLEE